MNDIFQTVFMVSLLSGMIRIATPILFAALGELVVERSGILNLGVEGAMLAGAFVGFVTGFLTGSLWLGVLMGIMAGGVLNLLMAFMAVTLKVDQTVAGLTINLFSAGLTFYLFRIIFKSTGSQNLPSLHTFDVARIPLLSSIPFIGEVLFSQYMLSYLAFLVLLPGLVFYLYKTKYGLNLRCLGENPEAMDMKGVSVSRYQYLALIFGGMMAGAGGAFLTLASAGLFVPEIVGGRGWIAIAIVIFGDWKPFRIMLGALFFGLLDTFQLQIQGIGVKFPYQILLTLPYILTIVAVSIGRKRSGSPIHLGIPYKRK
jgi:general nucleoside transport system permease protein